MIVEKDFANPDIAAESGFEIEQPAEPYKVITTDSNKLQRKLEKEESLFM